MVGFGSQGEPQQKAECSGAHPLVAWGTEVCFSFSSPASVRDVRVARERSCWYALQKSGGPMRSSDKGQMLRISLSLLSFGLAFGGVFSGTRALAQSTATLEGTVRDPSGAVAPGVKIAVRNQGTGVERTTETESDGNYVVPALEPGVYRVEARAEGFRTQVVTDLRVDVGSIVVQNLELKLGTVTQDVSVTGTPLLTETATVSVGEVVTQRMVQEMPLNGRHLV